MNRPADGLSTGEALRIILAFLVLWLADVAMDLSDWLEEASWRIERPGRRAPRGLARLVVLTVLSGVSLTAGLAWGLRGTEARPGVEAGRTAPPPNDRPGDLMGAVAQGCIEGGGTFWMGQEAGVVVARCRPFLTVGVAPVPAARKGATR